MAYKKNDRRDDERSERRGAEAQRRSERRGAEAQRRREGGERGERREGGERGGRREGGERGGRREGGERGGRREGGDRRELKPNQRGSSYSNRPLRSSDENRDRKDRSERKPYAERSENRDTNRNQYKPRSKKSFDDKPERKRADRPKKSDKITPRKPGAFDVFDKRFAKPNIKEEIRKERRERREVEAQRERGERRERGGAEAQRGSRERGGAETQRGSRERGGAEAQRGSRERGGAEAQRSQRGRGERGGAEMQRSQRPRSEKPERAKPERARVDRKEVVEEQQYTGYDRKKAAPGEEIRLNKFIANSGVCSRRKADELIEKGEITVNGEVVRELGYKVKHTDKIKYEGKLLKPGKLVYVLLNKPKDYITTMDDPEERRTVVQLTAKATNERIFPVGRLDRNTTGLLLLTNDGDLADKLAHPRNQVKKIYEVELDKSLSTSDFEKIKAGVELEDGLAKPDQLSYLDGKSKKFLGIEIHIGRNRIVRRIFESLGYEVVRLDRVVYAGLTKKDLPRGRHRMLTKEEIIYLKHLNKY